MIGTNKKTTIVKGRKLSLASFSATLSRTSLAIALLIILPFVGTTGYMLIEGWGFLDAYYMSVITLSTIGYGEIQPLSSWGRIFTMVFIVSGVGTVFYSLGILAEIMVRPELLRRRWIQKKKERMQDHFIICGYGRYGQHIAEELSHLGKDFIVIDKDEKICTGLVERGWVAVVGDAASEDILRQARIEQAAGLVAASGSPAENIFIVLSARAMKSALHIVARGETPEIEIKLQRAGASSVFSPFQVGAERMTHMLLQQNLVDSFSLVSKNIALDIVVEKVSIEQHSYIANRRLSTVRIRKEFQATILAIQFPDGNIQFPPSAETILTPGIVLIIAVAATSLVQLRLFLTTGKGG